MNSLECGLLKMPRNKMVPQPKKLEKSFMFYCHRRTSRCTWGHLKIWIVLQHRNLIKLWATRIPELICPPSPSPHNAHRHTWECILLTTYADITVTIVTITSYLLSAKYSPSSCFVLKTTQYTYRVCLYTGPSRSNACSSVAGIVQWIECLPVN